MTISLVQHAAGPGHLKCVYGDFVNTESATAGSITLAGGRIYSASFQSIDATGVRDIAVRTSVSQSGAIMTMTIYLFEGVTDGRFMVWYQ